MHTVSNALTRSGHVNSIKPIDKHNIARISNLQCVSGCVVTCNIDTDVSRRVPTYDVAATSTEQ